jgi:hypothetical protein
MSVTKTILTKDEIMNAIGYAASLKNGLTGEYYMKVKFNCSTDGVLIGAEIEQSSAPAGSTGQPPLYAFRGATVAAASATKSTR